ncbi:family 2 glycosyl transferase, partial [Streptomyces sp. NPDC048279]
FGWRQPVAALIAFASAAGPLLLAAGWMIAGADGPVERRDATQVPAFVAEDSATTDQVRTLVLDSDSTARVDYMLVRGSGARMGDAEVTAADGENAKLDKVVANLVAGSGADQADQLGGFAVRYVLVHKGAPRDITRVLDATPGLSRLSQQNGGALWRVDQQVSRAAVVAANGSGTPAAVAAGPVDIHTTIPAGAEGRILRLADSAAPGWTATLDGKPLTRTTVDGWAQGFELPSSGGKLDVTYDTPFTHGLWLWIQGALAVVLVVLALPGRRRDVDDDLPEEEQIPAQPVEGEGRRARRLRAQAESEEAATAEEAEEFPATDEFPVSEGEQAQASVPQQPSYDEWDPASYPAGEGYQSGYADQYQDTGAGQYQQGYDQQTYDPYQTGQYDPYAYGGQQGQQAYDPTYQQGYDPAYDPAAQHHHGTGGEHHDGSQQ